MSLQEKRLGNKVRVLEILNKDLKEQSNAIYEDLSQTRAEVGALLDKRTEEMQEEMLNILAKAICFMTVGKDEKAFKYLIEQYELIKKDLSDNNHDDRQVTLKILM